MTRRRARSRESLDRWLVSYADFITLLFSFFVVLYAFAKADHIKQVQVAQAIDRGFQSMGILPGAANHGSGLAGRRTAVVPVNVVMGENLLSTAEVKDDLTRIQRDMARTLSGQIAAHTVSLQMGREGLVISLHEAGFFASGSATPRPETLPTLQKIAASLAQSPYDLRVEGHTDDIPIHTAAFDSNWELSTARATRIARMFLELGTLPAERISAAGYAEFRPVAGNDTEEGRALNRRVDLVVMPETRLNFAAEPGTRREGPWRRITDHDPPASQPPNQQDSEPADP